MSRRDLERPKGAREFDVSANEGGLCLAVTPRIARPIRRNVSLHPRGRKGIHAQMVPHTIRSDRAGRIIVSAGVFLFIALSSLARADQVLPPRPQTPIEAALGVHRTWHLTVPDSASRASRRVAAMARVRAQMADASGTPPRILFAEPPEIDSLPPVPPKYPPPPDSITSGLRSVVIDDLDGDGLGDVAALAPADSVLVIRRNLGGGHYGPPQTYPLASGAFKIALADFNGDGKLDVAVANQAYP
ncbi:MAG TPA: VCBS repeat-containing protein, partial [Candidatus Udaeobacter sp.]|nr:VCBS repeat-containing protein [Candidatus Udaeobacter sp.]